MCVRKWEREGRRGWGVGHQELSANCRLETMNKHLDRNGPRNSGPRASLVIVIDNWIHINATMAGVRVHENEVVIRRTVGDVHSQIFKKNKLL